MKSQNQNYSKQSGNNRGFDNKSDKLVNLINKSIGKNCNVTVNSGIKYKGVLVNEKPSSITLKNPIMVSKTNDDLANNLSEKLNINLKDVIDLQINNTNSFKTDSDISNTKFKERELEKWVPETDDLPVNMSLEEDNTSNWDQFKANEDKFGVGSTYDEHLYTTRINTDTPDYEIRLKKADQLAKEIENQETSDPHMLEERGKIDDSGVDEETKYSGVDRRGDELMAALKSVNLGDKKYVPPRPKALNNTHNDPAIASLSPKENKSQKKPDSIPAKPQVTNGPPVESFRLNAQSEINSLKEFSANFTVPHRMPNDLLPILSKDKSKQDEIIKRQVEMRQSSTSGSNSASNSNTGTPQVPKKKMDPTKPAFKLNPKAAAFTPSAKPNQLSPSTTKPAYSKSPNNPSPRMNSNQRPYSNSSNTTSNSKRHYQISPADFFGGTNKIPTKEAQVEKTKKFKLSFSLFLTTKSKAQDSNSPVTIEKPFATPPTWDSTFDESYDKLFPIDESIRPPVPMMQTSPFMPSPMMTPMAGGYGGAGAPNSSKYPMSPQQQQQQQQAAAMAQAAHFQQQQFQAAMFYQQQQQQFGGMPPGQPPMTGMYMPNAMDPSFTPPGYVPSPVNFGAGSPQNGHIMMGNSSPYTNNSHHYNNNNNHRRYSKRSN